MESGTKNKDSRSRMQPVTVQVIIDVALWISVALPTLFLFLQGTPYEKGFFCDDKSLSYPYKPDTVSTTALIAAGCITSVVVVVLTEVLNSVDSKCRRPCQPISDTMFCVKSYCIFLVGFIVQELVVDFVKNKMGVLRPNFFDVCRPKFNRTLCPGYISEYTCTGMDYGEHTERDSRQSFPSGHSSFSMYIAVFFCIYIQSRLQIKFSRILKFFLQAGLIFTAVICGLGRIKDNKHHPSDVIAGFIIGTTVAIFVCRTVGRNMLWSPNTTCTDNLPTHSMNKTCDLCGTGENTPDQEPQTPSPLLPNEYFHRVSSGLEISAPNLKSFQNKNARNLTIPVKPVGRLENV